jgi:hypothetical protein
MLRRRLQWRGARLQTGKRQVRSLRGALVGEKWFATEHAEKKGAIWTLRDPRPRGESRSLLRDLRGGSQFDDVAEWSGAGLQSP